MNNYFNCFDDNPLCDAENILCDLLESQPKFTKQDFLERARALGLRPSVLLRLCEEVFEVFSQAGYMEPCGLTGCWRKKN